MPKETTKLTHFQAECLSDEFGRAKVINFLYDHPKGLNFSQLKTLVEKDMGERYPDSQNILHVIPDRMLFDFLTELELAQISTPVKKGIYRLQTEFRKFLDKVLGHAEKEHAQYSRRG